MLQGYVLFNMKLLKFTSQTCAPCKELTKVLYDLLPVDFNHIELIEIDVTVDKEAARDWNLKGVPTLILLDEMGEEVSKMVGYRGVKPLSQFLRGEL